MPTQSDDRGSQMHIIVRDKICTNEPDLSKALSQEMTRSVREGIASGT